jgi:hypothetical protein
MSGLPDAVTRPVYPLMLLELEDADDIETLAVGAE